MKDKEENLGEIDKLATEIILEEVDHQKIMESSPFWKFLIGHKEATDIIKKSTKDKIVACIKDLGMFYEMLEPKEFELRLTDIVENIISLIKTGEEGKAFKKYKKYNCKITIDNKDLTDDLRQSILKVGFEEDKDGKV